MSRSSQHAIRITAPATPGPLSPSRKKFNTLVKKLEAERVNLALWREELPKIRALADSEYRPLVAIFDGHRKQMVLMLDEAYSDKTMSKKNKEKLAELICSAAVELMPIYQEDEQIKAIYNKYSGSDYGLELEAEKALMREMVEKMTGVVLDDDTDFSSPAAFFKSMQEQMAEQIPDEAAPTATPTKPSAREVRLKAEEAKLKQSVRDIFRKLAGALHPDREIDPAEHERKTALMQRANIAYAANDLLGLLELQLEVDQIDQTGIDNLGDDRIKQYNRILEGQVNEIKYEINILVDTFSLHMGCEFGPRRTPKLIMQSLRDEIVDMKSYIKSIETDLAVFVDMKKLKAWLKNYDNPYLN